LKHRYCYKNCSW